MKIPSRSRVILRRCSSYDVERIRTIVREGLEELDLRPHGRTLVKPNVVASGPMMRPSARATSARNAASRRSSNGSESTHWRTVSVVAKMEGVPSTKIEGRAAS